MMAAAVWWFKGLPATPHSSPRPTAREAAEQRFPQGGARQRTEDLSRLLALAQAHGVDVPLARYEVADGPVAASDAPTAAASSAPSSSSVRLQVSLIGPTQGVEAMLRESQRLLPHASTEHLGKRKSTSASANKENPGFPNTGIGTKKIMDVANSIEERLVKYGRLSEDGSVIKRKMHNNFDYYEQDDFINDPDDPQLPNSMEIVSSKFDDYFMLRGGIEALKKHAKYGERQGLMKRRNRENKLTRTIEQKKKREEMQIHSLKIKIDAALPADPPKETHPDT